MENGGQYTDRELMEKIICFDYRMLIILLKYQFSFLFKVIYIFLFIT